MIILKSQKMVIQWLCLKLLHSFLNRLNNFIIFADKTIIRDTVLRGFGIAESETRSIADAKKELGDDKTI